MATVVRIRGDERGRILGEGVGTAMLAYAARRKEEEDKKKRKEALQNALALFSAGMKGGTTTQAVPQKERVNKALKAGGGPTKAAASNLSSQPKTMERKVTGKDVASALLEADLDEKFAFAISQGLDEARLSREREAKQSEAIERALKIASEQGATKQDIIGAISSSDLDSESKIRLLQQVGNFVSDQKTDTQKMKLFGPGNEQITVNVPPEVANSQEARQKFVDEKFPGFRVVPQAKEELEAEDDFTIELSAPDGETIKVPVPKSVAASMETRQQFVQENFPGYSADPVKKPERDPEGIKEEALRQLVEDEVISEAQAKKHAAGLIRVVPLSDGSLAMTDLSTNQTRFIQSGQMTASTKARMEQRIGALTDAILLLERTDPTQAGLQGAIASSFGGIAVQVPVLRSIASALGLDEREVAEIQAARGQFFNALMPLAQSFSAGGSRSGLATNRQIDLAERIQNMVKLTSTPGGAALAKKELIDVLSTIRTRLIAQRQTGTAIPPVIFDPGWQLDGDNLTTTNQAEEE